MVGRLSYQSCLQTKPLESPTAHNCDITGSYSHWSSFEQSAVESVSRAVSAASDSRTVSDIAELEDDEEDEEDDELERLASSSKCCFCI